MSNAIPTLALKQVTVKFGGLTAASEVDFVVERGQIASIIGPNGAGKTTVFNAISGVCPLTSGSIEFDGPPLAHPWSARVVMAALAVGLGTAALLAALAADLDGLWGAVIKRNYAALDAPFNFRGAWRDFEGYFRGDLAIEQRSRRWVVVTADGRRRLATEANDASAAASRDRLQRVLVTLQTQPNVRLIDDGGSRYSIAPLTAAQPRPANAAPPVDKNASQPVADAIPLGQFGAQTLAERQLDSLRSIAGGQSARTFRLWASAIGGFALGLAGTLSVWRRSRHTPEVVALAGIGRTFQNIRLFGHMTVLENVLAASDRRLRAGVWQMAVRAPSLRREEAAETLRAREILEFVGVTANHDSLARNLPYGDQRRLEIARALATDPRLILLDEPAAGMNPAESVGLTRLIARIRDRGVTVLLIEHHMRVVMGISDRIAVLDHGVKIGDGTPQEIRNHPDVIRAYLGDEEVT